jgi:hypothetical protein
MAATKKQSKRVHRWGKPNLGMLLPRSGTDALLRYQQSFSQINNFQDFVLNMVGHIEHTAEKMRELKGILDKVNPARANRETKAEWKGPIEDLKKHRQFFIEILLVRHVENYLNFLSSLLKVVFIARPEVLRSSEKIDLETVFRHSSIDDLVKTVAERKVDSLSYASFGDLADYFNEKFHMVLVGEKDLQSVIEAIETRNISVHNRCVVNQRYLSRTGRKNIELGEIRILGIEDLEKIAVVLTQSAISVDKEARKSLGLKGVRFNRSNGDAPNNSFKPKPLRGSA